MHTKWRLCSICFGALSTVSVMADSDTHEHGGQIFHAFQLTAGVGTDNHSDKQLVWDFDGWIGSDNHKLWLKSEGEQADSEMETTEFSALYSRNISTFWDAQMGVRYDTQPDTLGYLALGFEGLAPYFFETSAHLFVSEDGDVSARVHVENEWLFTQRLILQPFLEADLYAQEVTEQAVGTGLTTTELGLQLRYEITRKFAPYVEINYERAFGDTAAIREQHDESREAVRGMVGMRLLF